MVSVPWAPNVGRTVVGIMQALAHPKAAWTSTTILKQQCYTTTVFLGACHASEVFVSSPILAP